MDMTVIGSKIDNVFRIESRAHGQDLMRTADRVVQIGEELVRRYAYQGRSRSTIPVSAAA